MCFMDFVSAFDSVERKLRWQIMVADRTHPKLLRLIKTYNVFTKTKVRAGGGDLISFEVFSWFL